ncbi:hypothetical protein M409DRAFT_17902 [Zasmidium cellare ATCC 36951]|uniref:Uncharacterized protein n=1 Tax=Zasmidium cellare ATCC 36951 TaxID=1080233 RepID=A0A6A6CXA7_ZASCE|nr:uncharacterized protein M409DRAFT_17902 [Zasmidium cellare ATCC 36951]KAF2171665.1 hypothetical protein M409DRAFT_17902 [Zasmidium cellare ATCC 36951]
MVDFTSLPAEVKLGIMEHTRGFDNLANLCDTTRELSTLFKLFQRQIVASVSRNYPEISANFTQDIFRADNHMDAVVTVLAPGLDGKPLTTYRVAEEEPCCVDKTEKLRPYHDINLELSAIVEMCMASKAGIYGPLFDTPLTPPRRIYTKALYELVHILVLAGGMERHGIDSKNPKFHHPSPREIVVGKRLNQPMNVAKMSFVIQSLQKLPFDELVTVGDILLVVRDQMRQKSTCGSTPYADNRLFKLLCDCQTNGDMCAMLLLAHLWVLIREHTHRDNTVFTRHRVTYKMAQDEVFKRVAKYIDTRMFHGEGLVRLGELRKVETAYRMPWRDVRVIAMADVYEALGT